MLNFLQPIETMKRISREELAEKLDAMRKEGAETVLKKDAAISAKYSK